MSVLEIAAIVVIVLIAAALLTAIHCLAVGSIAASQAAVAAVSLSVTLASLAAAGSAIALAAVVPLLVMSVSCWYNAECAILAHLRRVAGWGHNAPSVAAYVRRVRRLQRLHLADIVGVEHV